MGEITKTITSVAEGAFSAVGSAIGTAANGITSLASSAVTGISEIPSLLESSFNQVGQFAEVIGGTIADVGSVLDPQSFFETAGSQLAGFTGELFNGPLTDIATAIADPVFDFGNGIADFAGNVFGGGLVDSITDTFADISLTLFPVNLLANTFETNLLSMTSIFDSLLKLDPVQPDFKLQFSTARVQLGRLSLGDRVINKVLIRMQEFTERISQTSLVDTHKEAMDRIDDERRRRFKERFE